jgi:hypothetical protein
MWGILCVFTTLCTVGARGWGVGGVGVRLRLDGVGERSPGLDLHPSARRILPILPVDHLRR